MAINMQHNKYSFLDSSQLVTAREQANERKEQLQLAIDQLKEGMAKQLELLESQIKFVKIMMPFAPHLSCECLSKLEGKNFYEEIKWPEGDKSLLKDQEITLVVESILKDLKLVKSIEYQSLVSPKYYNFSNDSIDLF